MKKQTLKFNDGEITVNFNRTITVHEDLENNETWLCIPGLPSNDQANRIGRVAPPTLTNSKRHFIVADDHKGNSVLAMVQGELNDKMVEHAKDITDKQYIRFAQSFLDNLKKEVDHE